MKTSYGLSLGVTAIGIINIALGIILVLLSPYIIVILGFSDFHLLANFDELSVRVFFLFKALINILLEIVLIIAGYGTLFARRRAITLASVYAWGKISIVSVGVLGLISHVGKSSIRVEWGIGGLFFSLAFWIVYIAYPVVLIVFYSKQSVKDQLNKEWKKEILEEQEREGTVSGATENPKFKQWD